MLLVYIVVVIPGHNLGNSQVSVNTTIGPTLVLLVRFWLLCGHLLGYSYRLGWSFVLIVFCLFSFFIYFRFKSGIWLLIAPVPVHCFSLTINMILT